MGRKSYKTLILSACVLAACVKDRPVTAVKTSLGNARRVYVVCEGNYGSGNATLYGYEPLPDSVSGDLYERINNSRLGDVFQSMTKIGGRFFLCVNHSDKVVALDSGSLACAGTIAIPEPRYVLPIDATKAYVSSEYRNKVYVINPSAMQVTDSVSLPFQNTEGMCLYHNTAFICAWDTACNTIFKVDVNTGQVVQAIKVAGYAPQEALLDKEQMLWVLSGDQPEGRGCAWTRIDPSSGDVLASYLFPSDADAVRPVFNNGRDTLYFIEANYKGGTNNNGIYRMGIHDAALPLQPFIAALPLQYYWALGIDPGTGHVYAGDPKGFVQKGSVYIFRQDGTAIDTFSVGLGPGHFYFDE